MESDIKKIEQIILEKRKDQEFPIEGKDIFVIDTAPPYLNGELHMGHAVEFTLDDIVARVKRMEGYKVVFPLGLDRNGIPVENKTEEIHGIKAHDVPREKFLEMCKDVLDSFQAKFIEGYKRLGVSFNTYKIENKIGGAYQTDSKEYRALTQAIFIYLWNKGIIYEADKVINYCPVCKTTISDNDVEYKEKETDLVYFKAGEFQIATTRPELIFACAAVAVNPNDERYKDVSKIKMPIIDKEVPVIRDESIDPKFGTGMMMVCSYGDKNDVFLFKKYNLQPKIVIDNDGKMINTKLVDGLYVKDAREKVKEIMKEKGVLVKVEKIISEKPICERSKNEIEFLPEKDLYISQVKFKEELRKLADSSDIFGVGARALLNNWISGISEDWPITRSRFYATEVPLWKCLDCGTYIVPEPGKYYRPWKEKYPGKCPKCGSTNIVGDTRVFDTWMDSSNTPFFIAGIRNINKEGKFEGIDNFEEYLPSTIRIQGRDIVRTWMYYTLLKGFLLMHDSPVKHWLIHFWVNMKGEKMSKSKGNIIPMLQAIETHGADVIRLMAISNGDIFAGNIDYNERFISGAKRFLTKLINIAKYISQFNDEEVKIENKFNKMVLEHFNFVYAKVKDYYDKYMFFDAFKTLREFIIDVFADHIIELTKKEAYNSNKEVIHMLHYVLFNSLKLLYPMIPFTTDYLFTEIYKKDITKEKLDEIQGVDHSKEINKLMEIDSAIWKYKKANGMSLNSSIKREEVNKILAQFNYNGEFDDILIIGHNIV